MNIEQTDVEDIHDFVDRVFPTSARDFPILI
jgi:hypothetical protein